MSNSDVINALPDIPEEELEEVFFEKHGVGEYEADKDFKEVDYLLDKTKATFKEREFVRHMLNGHSQTEAYLRAYDTSEGEIARSSATYSASRLIRRKRVKEYYFELMQEREQLAEENLPKLMAELNEDRKLARDIGQPSAAIAAVKAKANLLGLENQPVNNNLTLNIMDDATKDALIERIVNRREQSRGEVIETDFKDITGE